MTRLRLLTCAAGLALAAGCGERRRSGPESPASASLDCTAGWRRAQINDGALSLCVPPGFEARGARRYARPRGDTLPEHWISASLDSASEWAPGDPWPLRLASGAGCVADCAMAEASRTYQDTLAGVQAFVEVGRVSGGFAGAHREPSLVASAEVRPGLRLTVNAVSPDTMLLDSLRAGLRTVRLAGHLTNR